jgi:hypothetical protein
MHSTSHVRLSCSPLAFLIPLQSFPIEQFQHLPNPYPHDAIRDSFLRTNIVNLDLASPPPQRLNPRSHPLTPPDTPGHRRVSSQYDHHQSEPSDSQNIKFDSFVSAGLFVDVKNRPTRYLVVGGVPADASTNDLSRVFTVCSTHIFTLRDLTHCSEWETSRACSSAIRKTASLFFRGTISATPERLIPSFEPTSSSGGKNPFQLHSSLRSILSKRQENLHLSMDERET